MQITVNETDIQIKNGKLIININSDLEKILGLNKEVLSSVKVGSFINNKYIVLEHFNDGTTAVIRKNLLKKKMNFSDSDNDWRTSNIGEYLNDEFIKEIESEFGKDNIINHMVNLISMDGLDDYGTCRDKVSLLNIDQYRKYRKLLGENMDKSWWLLTPNSTPSGTGSSCVQFVGSVGGVRCGGCGWHVYGVRPFFILKSDIFVSCDRDIRITR